MLNKEDVLVCLPTYNEQESVEWMIDEIRAMGYDLIVVDGHSTDGTFELAKQKNVSLYQREGFGKGAAVIKALDICHKLGYDYMALIDCDTTYLPSNLPQLAEFIPKYDMIVGARCFNWQMPLRATVNLGFTKIVNFLFSGHYTDIHSGMRIMNVAKFVEQLDAEGFEIETQISIVALKGNMNIQETPIALQARRGESKVTPFVVIRMLWLILKEAVKK